MYVFLFNHNLRWLKRYPPFCSTQNFTLRMHSSRSLMTSQHQMQYFCATKLRLMQLASCSGVVLVTRLQCSLMSAKVKPREASLTPLSQGLILKPRYLRFSFYCGSMSAYIKNMNLFNRGELAACYFLYRAYTLFQPNSQINGRIGLDGYVIYSVYNIFVSNQYIISIQVSESRLINVLPFFILWVFWDNQFMLEFNSQIKRAQLNFDKYSPLFNKERSHQPILIQLIVKLVIINHTMLQNSTPLCVHPSHTDRINPAAQLFIFQTLIQEIEQHKRSLSQALTINSLLVQEASNGVPTMPPPADTTDNEVPFPLGVVKLEEREVQESESVEIQVRKHHKRCRNQDSDQTHDKNQTKNIPKNYGKAILSFIQKNIQKYISIIKPILNRGKLTINDLLLHIKRHKKEVNSINYLKEMWGYQDKHNPILKCIRVLSYVFMRKHCLAYIFNSRVKNYSTHIKYRTRIIEGIEHPEEFTCIKQF